MILVCISQKLMRASVLTAIALFCYLVTITPSYADITDVRNFYQFSDNVLSAGQPKRRQLERVSEDSIEVVINIVPAYESIYEPDEAEILRKQGIEYIHTPVNWESPKASEIENFLVAMKKVDDRKVLVHCWVNARASALVHVYQMTQSSVNQAVEYESLRVIWDDIAGFSLDNNDTWQQVIKEYAVETN